MLTRREAIRMALAASAGASSAVLRGASKEFWESKPSAEWSPDEVDRMITNSPWAKEASVSFNAGPGGFGSGNGGMSGANRGSRRSGGIGGIGGIGGAGGRGGGTGYPGGGSYPNGGSSPSGGVGRQQFAATIRWDSALPVLEALLLGTHDKSNPEFEKKYYVIHVLGDLPMMGNDLDRAETERREEMFKEYTKIERKDGSLQLEKVEEGSRIGSNGPGTLFYFSRLDGISLDDKQVTFVTKMGPVEVKAKFTLKDMLYHGKLAL